MGNCVAMVIPFEILYAELAKAREHRHSVTFAGVLRGRETLDRDKPEQIPAWCLNPFRSHLKADLI